MNLFSQLVPKPIVLFPSSCVSWNPLPLPPNADAMQLFDGGTKSRPTAPPLSSVNLLRVQIFSSLNWIPWAQRDNECRSLGSGPLFWVHAGEGVMPMQKPEEDHLRCFPLWHQFYCFETGIFTELEAHHLLYVRWPSTFETPLVSAPQCWNFRSIQHAWLLSCRVGFELRCPWSQSKDYCPLTHLSSLLKIENILKMKR